MFIVEVDDVIDVEIDFDGVDEVEVVVDCVVVLDV